MKQVSELLDRIKTWQHLDDLCECLTKVNQGHAAEILRSAKAARLAKAISERDRC
jgi:hypothetical protein